MGSEDWRPGVTLRSLTLPIQLSWAFDVHKVHTVATVATSRGRGALPLWNCRGASKSGLRFSKTGLCASKTGLRFSPVIIGGDHEFHESQAFRKDRLADLIRNTPESAECGKSIRSFGEAADCSGYLLTGST